MKTLLKTIQTLRKQKSKLMSEKTHPEESEATKAHSAFILAQIKQIIEVPEDQEKAFDSAAIAGKEQLSKKFKVVCMIGITGHGKSSTANSICGREKFRVSAGSESETDSVAGLLTRWQGIKEEEPVIVLDTPGFGDSKHRDTDHIANVVCGLKQIGYVHSFLIILNAEEPRLNEQLQATLKIFSQMFGTEFFKNAMMVFTHFYQDEKSIR